MTCFASPFISLVPSLGISLIIGSLSVTPSTTFLFGGINTLQPSRFVKVYVDKFTKDTSPLHSKVKVLFDMNDNAEEEEGIFTISNEQKEAIISSSTDDFLTLNEEWKAEVKKFYDEQGYVLIRGLLDSQMINKLKMAADQYTDHEQSLGASLFTSIKFGPVYNVDKQSNSSSFREVATRSAVPAFVAKILLELQSNDEEKKSNLRVLNDVFLAKTGKENSFCGWHVDDMGFWPCSAHQDPGIPVGVNAWIAINDIPSKTLGGGMAVVPRSHLTNKNGFEWIHDAYKVIGSTKLHPPEGFISMQEMMREVPMQTCSMTSLSPEIHNKMEDLMKVWDYKAGDVLLMSRWLWHRSLQTSEDSSSTVFQRYTIRYESGKSRTSRGDSVQKCVLYDSSNAGKTLDEVAFTTKLPFFPLAWPQTDDEVEMEKYVEEVLPKIKDKQQQRMAEIFSRT